MANLKGFSLAKQNNQGKEGQGQSLATHTHTRTHARPHAEQSDPLLLVVRGRRAACRSSVFEELCLVAVLMSCVCLLDAREVHACHAWQTENLSHISSLDNSPDEKMPITPFGGPLWASRCQEIEGDTKNQGDKATKKQKKTNAKT